MWAWARAAGRDRTASDSEVRRADSNRPVARAQAERKGDS